VHREQQSLPRQSQGPPLIFDIEPRVASEGTFVTVRGERLNQLTSVKISKFGVFLSCFVLSQTDDQLKFCIPMEIRGGEGNQTLSFSHGETSSIGPSRFGASGGELLERIHIVANLPKSVVAGINPSYGSVGQLVTVEGVYLCNYTSIKFRQGDFLFDALPYVIPVPPPPPVVTSSSLTTTSPPTPVVTTSSTMTHSSTPQVSSGAVATTSSTTPPITTTTIPPPVSSMMMVTTTSTPPTQVLTATVCTPTTTTTTSTTPLRFLISKALRPGVATLILESSNVTTPSYSAPFMVTETFPTIIRCTSSTSTILAVKQGTLLILRGQGLQNVSNVYVQQPWLTQREPLMPPSPLSEMQTLMMQNSGMRQIPMCFMSSDDGEQLSIAIPFGLPLGPGGILSLCFESSLPCSIPPLPIQVTT
jgi:hypothetical protein